MPEPQPIVRVSIDLDQRSYPILIGHGLPPLRIEGQRAATRAIAEQRLRREMPQVVRVIAFDGGPHPRVEQERVLIRLRLDDPRQAPRLFIQHAHALVWDKLSVHAPSSDKDINAVSTLQSPFM